MQFDTEAWLYSIALRSFAWWAIEKHRLGLGNRLVGASQFMNDSGHRTGFVMLESGLDWEYPYTGLPVRPSAEYQPLPDLAALCRRR